METCGYKPPVACKYHKLFEQNQAVKSHHTLIGIGEQPPPQPGNLV